MREKIDKRNRGIITGPALNNASKIVFVCGMSGAAGDDAALCASKGVASAAAISEARIFMPKVP
jgi:hypothetical protein